MSEKIDVAFEVKAKNGKLYELVQKFGSVKALAEYLNFRYQTVNAWLNFRAIPSFNFHNKKTEKRYKELELKLLELGYFIDDVFPISLRGKSVEKAQRRLVIRQEVFAKQLTESMQIKALPSRTLERNEASENLLQVLEKALTPREFKVITMRFGLNGETENTLEAIGKEYAITRETVRQIEEKALKILRHPYTSKILYSYMEDNTFETHSPYFDPFN